MIEEPRERRAEDKKAGSEEGWRALSPSYLPTFSPSDVLTFSPSSAATTRPSCGIRPPILGMAEHFQPGEQRRVRGGMKALASLGVRHIRIEMAWADWHEAGGRDWYQWLIGALSPSFTVLPSLVYLPPSRAVAAEGSIPPEDPKAFADFLEALADHFAGTFEWIELPSEPIHPGLWDWRLDPRGHIFSQIITSAAYRCRQRGIKTVLGGVHAGDLGWLSLMCENGVVDFADAIGLQDDPAAPVGHCQAWSEVVREARGILGEHCRNAPLWITGAGCSTDNHDEFAQCEAFMGLLNADVDRVYWSRLQDPEPSSSDRDGLPRGAPRRHLGLLRSDGTPRLLFRLWHSQGIEGIRLLHTYGSRRRLHGPGDGAVGSSRGCDCEAHSAGRPASDKTSRATVPRSTILSGLDFSGRPVLITGGAGFIGSNLAERLLGAGQPVMILDNLSRAGVEHNVRYLCDAYGDLLEVYIGDVRNTGLVEKLVARCASIFHLAGQVAVTASLADPAGDFESNLQGTLNVLEAARRQETPPALLFTSTGRVYGDLHDVELIPIGKRYVPRDHGIRTRGISESRPLDFQSPYGCSKGAADQYVLDYARMYDLPGIVFRTSCIYGRRQLGTEDQGWVAHFVLQLLRDSPLTLYGDGRQVRDILYIDDLLDALLLAIGNIEAVAGKAFNIGGGPDNAVSLLEVIGQLAELSGIEPRIRYGPRRQGDQPYYVSDIRRFSDATGWTPQISVQHGVPRLYHWFLENVQPGVPGESTTARAGRRGCRSGHSPRS